MSIIDNVRKKQVRKSQRGLGPGGKGLGPGGVCECPSCGHQITHSLGEPCEELTCPKCHTLMDRLETETITASLRSGGISAKGYLMGVNKALKSWVSKTDNESEKKALKDLRKQVNTTIKVFGD